MHPPTSQSANLLQAAFDAHRAGELATAESGYRAVLQVEPDNADALHLLGVLQRALGRPELAVDLIRRALVLAPGLVDAHANLGNALRELDRWDEAATSYAAALRLNPSTPDVRPRLTEALRQVLERGEARSEVIEALFPLSVDADMLETLLLAARAWQHNDSEANWQRLWDLHNRAGLNVERCRAFLADAPRCPMRLIALGNALRRARLGQAAEAIYRAAMAIAPDNPFVLTRLACLLLEQGRLESADRLLRKSAALHPGRAEAIRFGQSFLGSLRSRKLPELDLRISPVHRDAPLVIFAACDGVYFEKFASALLNSVVRNAGVDCRFHLHVINPPPDIAGRVADYDHRLGTPGIDLSVAHVAIDDWDTETRRTWFACARFRLLPQIMAAYCRPVLMLDVDLIVLRDLSSLIEAASDGDVAMVGTEFHRQEPWNWFWADVVFANVTDAAHDYFGLVARYIDALLELGNARWFLDQIALAACLLGGFRNHTPPQVVVMPPDIHRLRIDHAAGIDAPPAETVLFWSAHASTVDPAFTLGTPRYQDYVLR